VVCREAGGRRDRVPSHTGPLSRLSDRIDNVRMIRRSLLRDVGAQGRDPWVSAALEVLSTQGVDGVRVELLARRLKITKGSFYHHFKDRDDLHAAMLQHWRRRLVVDVIEELERVADPHERFRELMRVSYDVARVDRDIDLAIMLWARQDRRAAAALEDADRMRTDFIGRTLIACGVPHREAVARAVLTLAFLRAAPALDEEQFTACERLLIKP
jgi:AcrR family transcriptional regulator